MGRGRGCGHNIQGGDWLIVDRIRWKVPGPLDCERHPDTAFQGVELVTAEWLIACERLDRSTVIAQKNNQRLIEKVLRLERLKNTADAIVQGHDHGSQKPPTWIGNIGYTIQIALRRFIGVVRSIVG